ncbi:uncharacterized protein G2W53_001481 [Senna tora]|uniref:Uncharacterized protein n=1 Tax=Senna tora TaxID=362788 RepID=A0A835CKC8_9FABA|nr:uncharacterized protein G2W53_001481 [Senna tora]
MRVLDFTFEVDEASCVGCDGWVGCDAWGCRVFFACRRHGVSFVGDDGWVGCDGSVGSNGSVDDGCCEIVVQDLLLWPTLPQVPRILVQSLFDSRLFIVLLSSSLLRSSYRLPIWRWQDIIIWG